MRFPLPPGLHIDGRRDPLNLKLQQGKRNKQGTPRSLASMPLNIALLAAQFDVNEAEICAFGLRLNGNDMLVVFSTDF